jgi:hypothetical protein
VATKPSYEDGHLIVAAVRVLCFRNPKPPTPADIASFLGIPPEFARNLAVALGGLGILRVLENPFELRVELGNHLLLEDLPREADSPSIKEELDSFIERRKKQVEETEKMLSLDEIQKKQQEKISKLEDEMRRMKKSKYRPRLE